MCGSLQAVLSRMAAVQGHPQLTAPSVIDRMAIASKAFDSGRHEQAVRNALASIVRASSRWVPACNGWVNMLRTALNFELESPAGVVFCLVLNVKRMDLIMLMQITGA